jgi:putative hydrolase of the HAD superfamily
MIIFDYGHTLVYEDTWDAVKANKELYKYNISNKNNVTAEQIAEVADKFFVDTNVGRKNDIEVHAHQFQNFVNEYLQIETSLSPVEYEKILWDNAAPAYPMANIKEVLKYLRENDIRTGVISNISFSGEALKNRINEVLPDNNFEFIIASSEYIFRKPNRFIFDIALRKANLLASEVWYCGDSVDYDVAGANSAGIFPVWYESEIECWYRERGKQAEPECEHLHITNWRELIRFLENLK